MKVNKIEDSISVINAREKPLAAYLFTDEKKLEEEFIGSVSAGGMSINETTLHVIIRRVEHMPTILYVYCYIFTSTMSFIRRDAFHLCHVISTWF